MKKFMFGQWSRAMLLAGAISMSLSSEVFSQTYSYSQCFQSYKSNLGSNLLVVKMSGLHGYVRANNTGGAARTLTVRIENIDPDFIQLSEGTITARGNNTLTFSWSIAAGATRTVYINPWYLTDDNFYFIAWGDSQHHPERFERALDKGALINPVLSVAAGDCVKHGDDGGCVGGGGRPDVVTDQIYLTYENLFNDYPAPVFEALGNHDITRGGWATQNDANYGAGEALYRKYVQPTEYGFTVNPGSTTGGIHFLIGRFYYDMPNWNSLHYFGGCTPDGFLKFDANDVVGVALSNFISSDLSAASNASARISVTHHGFNMFIGDHNTVANARALYQTGNVDYMIVGHIHNYGTGVDAPTQIPYLLTGDANGDAHSGNPGFSLVNVNNGVITQQHMLADNLTLNVNYTANSPSLTQGAATVTCSGYALPFIRLKFKLSNSYAAYQAKDVATNANLPTYSHQFPDYTVVYVETSIGNGATKNVQVNPITSLMAKASEEVITISPNPSSDHVTINLPGDEKATYDVAVTDPSGNVVRNTKANGPSVVIQLEGLKTGLYSVKITAGDKTVTTRRLIIK